MASNHQMDDRIKDLLNKARRYCAAAEQCEDSVRQKLVVWKASPAESDRVVKDLVAEGYINDERYARAYCESKILRQHWGRQKVLYHLRIRHLPRQAIDSGMATISNEAYAEVLRHAAEKKLAELSSLEDAWVRNQKLTAFLVSRGFTLQEINQTITNNTDL